MSGLLAGKRAVISGVGPGLGRALALLFAAEGASTVLAARHPDVLDAIAEEVRAGGGEALCVTADITVPADCDRLVAASTEALGGIDVLVNNAFATGPRELLADIDMEEWRLPLEVNLIATMRLSLAVAAQMAAAGGGSIVMVGTQAMRRSEPRRGPYAASKAALLSASRTLAAEWGPSGVRVNSVVPGHIWGPSLEAFFVTLAERRGTTPEEVHAGVARTLPLRRLPTAGQVAEAAAFFASERAAAITGQSLDVNGGNWFD